MKKLVFFVTLCALSASSQTSAQVADGLREQMRIREILLEGQLEDLDEVMAAGAKFGQGPV